MAGIADLLRELFSVIMELNGKVMLLLMCWAIEEELLGNDNGKLWIFVLDVWLCFGYGIILYCAIVAIITAEAAVTGICG